MPDLAAPGGWAYVTIWALIAIDAFVPVVPTQLVMITAGLLATHNDLHLAAVVLSGAAGAFSGDFACYQLGRRTSRVRPPGVLARLAGRRMRVHIRYGLVAILLCRFVPAGRFLTCFHAGRSVQPGGVFVVRAAVAALAWATYGALLGWVGGEAVTRSQWMPLAVAAVGATVFATAGWVSVLARPSRRRRTTPAATAGADEGDRLWRSTADDLCRGCQTTTGGV